MLLLRARTWPILHLCVQRRPSMTTVSNCWRQSVERASLRIAQRCCLAPPWAIQPPLSLPPCLRGMCWSLGLAHQAMVGAFWIQEARVHLAGYGKDRRRIAESFLVRCVSCRECRLGGLGLVAGDVRYRLFHLRIDDCRHSLEGRGLSQSIDLSGHLEQGIPT